MSGAQALRAGVRVQPVGQRVLVGQAAAVAVVAGVLVLVHLAVVVVHVGFPVRDHCRFCAERGRGKRHDSVAGKRQHIVFVFPVLIC